MTVQILWGSLVLGICSTVHLILIIWWINFLRRRSSHLNGNSAIKKTIIPIGGTFVLLILSHTIQVWIWAFSLIYLDALPDITDAIYFSLVTYTTLGYGDVTLETGYKIFGAMASVTGLLNFGVSTAVLVSVLGNALPDELRGEK